MCSIEIEYSALYFFFFLQRTKMIGFFRKDLLWVQTSLVLIAFPSSNCAASFFIEMLLVLERIGVFFFFFGPFLIVKELANVRNKLLGGDWHFSFVDRLWEIETSFGGRKRYYIFLCWCLCGMRVGRFPFGTLMATSFAIVNRLNDIYIYMTSEFLKRNLRIHL